MSRTDPPPPTPSEEERQLDFSIFLTLLGEEGREQFYTYLRLHRARRARDESNAPEQSGA